MVIRKSRIFIVTGNPDRRAALFGIKSSSYEGGLTQTIRNFLTIVFLKDCRLSPVAGESYFKLVFLDELNVKDSPRGFVKRFLEQGNI
jgi:hypothetical protein